MDSPINVALDVDGVVADLMGSMIVHAWSMGIHATPDDIIAYDPPFLKPVWPKVFDDPTYTMLLNLDVIEHPEFHPHAYVSKRGCPAWVTSAWVADAGLPRATVVHTNHDSKVDYLRHLEVDLFVEDSYDNYAEVRETGIECLLIDRPWNRNERTSNDLNYVISSLSEVGSKCETLFPGRSLPARRAKGGYGY